MTQQLTPHTLYNARRTPSGTVRRGTMITDWLQYGLYYGEPRYLQVHEFGNWFDVVLDVRAVDGENAINPDAFNNKPRFIVYLSYGAAFRRAAVSGGFAPPNYNPVTMAAFIQDYKAQIDHIMDTKRYNGIFWDECDVSYWDTSLSVAGSNVFRDVLNQLCDHVRSKSLTRPDGTFSTGVNIVNGSPYFGEVGEIFLLESFIGSYFGNAFAPSWRYNKFFTKMPFALAEGPQVGIPWSTGILPYLYTWKYGWNGPNKTVQYGHSYGDPLSVYQNDRQLQCFIGSKALGIESVNYIDPANQHMLHLYMHTRYTGLPLETPQFDVPNERVSRMFSGASLRYDDQNPAASRITMTETEPEYWKKTDQAFNEIPWDSGTSYPNRAMYSVNLVPEYLKVWKLQVWDDREFVYLRAESNDTLRFGNVLPLYLWAELDPRMPGKSQYINREIGALYLETPGFKAQFYIFGASLFKWDMSNGNSSADAWQFMYTIPVRKSTEKYNFSGDDITIGTDGVIRKPSGGFIAAGIRPNTRLMIGGSWQAQNNTEILVGTVTDTYLTQAAGPKALANDPGGHQITMTWSRDRVEYKIRKETLRYIVPSWDNQSFRFFLGFAGNTGAAFFTASPGDVTYDKTTTVTRAYNPATYATRMPLAYVPHNAVVYAGTPAPGQQVSSITVDASGSCKVWVFDRVKAKFVGPDGTPYTWWVNPLQVNVPAGIDATEILVAIAHDSMSPTDDSWEVRAISVDTTPMASPGQPVGYDVAFPRLVEYEKVYKEWENVTSPKTIDVEYIPIGMERGLIQLQRDNQRDSFQVTFAATDEVVGLLKANDIRNKEIRLRRTYEGVDHTNPDTVETLWMARVDNWSYQDGKLTLDCRPFSVDWGRMFPHRRMSYFCPYKFKDSRCKYYGIGSFCNKTYVQCESYKNEDNFGGMKTLPALLQGRWGQ